MTNKELQEQLKQYPDNAIVAFEYVGAQIVSYDKDANLINIE